MTTKILIIDDDPITRLLAAEKLTEENFRVFEAANGQQGLSLIQQVKPDLVLLDVIMPDMDGYEVCKEIRRNPLLASLPVIMLTGLEDTASIVRAYDYGATDFVTKPINWTLLVYRIHYILRASRIHDQLAHSESSLANAQRLAHLGSWEWWPEKDTTRRTSEYYRIVGVRRDVLETSMYSVLEHVHEEDRQILRDALLGAAKGTAYQLQFRIIAGNSGMRVLHEQTQVFYHPDGSIDRIEGITQDITELVAAQQRIRNLAYYDSLTGLANRQLFRELLQHELLRARRNNKQCALLFIDLDRFKRINDTLGHDKGDMVLQAIASRINTCVRSTDLIAISQGQNDMVARLGGDEFTIVLTDISQPEDAAQVAQRLLEVISQPITVGKQEIIVSASIGIAVAPEDGGDVEQLLKNADLAMYAVKDKGRNSYHFFDSTMNETVLNKFALENDLRKAIEQDQLELYFQPKVNPLTHELVGAEVLLRWKHPERGMISPAIFIPVAEESGYIVELGQWVLKQACIINSGWQSQGMPIVPLAINMSSANFRHPDLLAGVQRSLDESKLLPSFLVLELTEGILMQDISSTIDTLQALKTMGVSLSVDDFGTGYSSLHYLKRFPIDELKIDRSFVQDIVTDPNDAAITAAIIGLAQNLKLSVVAEGVETTEQADFLLQRGCITMQGFLFARPMPKGEFERFMMQSLQMAQQHKGVFMVDQ
ncbi:response regulator receiver modulated diguanylate cyclase/phosphodiesterase [Fluviicoccus keumensis]|uniref:cyclic-guanylate-specific phosphodiesterase n=1 Tax=Fluviicoccus keumensis TaxID=1435465 RepID=A0A4Q7ZBT3_9GAMM|nr:EAL domain-containing protein [Fluviicoccus keumensis]RZU47624.1 response regulator receiver modulated diguanylate cyclase/phosphodiesterase [Fluviicoccus keumensis]